MILQIDFTLEAKNATFYCPDGITNSKVCVASLTKQMVIAEKNKLMKVRKASTIKGEVKGGLPALFPQLHL